MRQKYMVCRNLEKKEIRIVEYAVIDKDLKKVGSEHLRNDHFTLLAEGTYKSESIINSISQGNAALLGMFRTHNIFPISAHANEIADTIRKLCSLPEDGTIELLFDDRELLSANQSAE